MVLMIYGARVNATDPNMLTSLIMRYDDAEKEGENVHVDGEVIRMLYAAGEIPDRQKFKRLPRCL